MSWDRRERPTSPGRDSYHQIGMMMADLRNIAHRLDDLEGRIIVLEHQIEKVMPRVRASIRAPAVKSGGVAFAVSSTLVVIFEVLRAIGLLR